MLIDIELNRLQSDRKVYPLHVKVIYQPLKNHCPHKAGKFYPENHDNE